MKTKQVFGIVGSIILFIGVFTPIISIPLMGNINYFQNGKGDGVFIMALSVVSLLLVLSQRYKWLIITGSLSLGLMLFTFLDFQSRLSTAQSEMEAELANNPFCGLADVAMQSIQIQWGWALLVIGAVSLIISAIIKDTQDNK